MRDDTGRTLCVRVLTVRSAAAVAVAAAAAVASRIAVRIAVRSGRRRRSGGSLLLLHPAGSATHITRHTQHRRHSTRRSPRPHSRSAAPAAGLTLTYPSNPERSQQRHQAMQWNAIRDRPHMQLCHCAAMILPLSGRRCCPCVSHLASGQRLQVAVSMSPHTRISMAMRWRQTAAQHTHIGRMNEQSH